MAQGIIDPQSVDPATNNDKTSAAACSSAAPDLKVSYTSPSLPKRIRRTHKQTNRYSPAGKPYSPVGRAQALYETTVKPGASTKRIVINATFSFRYPFYD